MPYNHPIPDAPIAPSMLPMVAAENLTSQDVLVLENQAVTTQKLAGEAREV